MSRVLLTLIVLLLMIGVAGAIPYQAGSFDPIRPNQADWVCYDYAIDYAQNSSEQHAINPNITEWKVITVSENPNFHAESHMLNYRINGSIIEFHDPQWSARYGSEIEYSVQLDDMRMGNPFFEPCYYHVWDVNRTPWRYYKNNVENIQEVA